MAEIDDLNAAVELLKADVADIGTKMDAEFAALQAALAANNGPAITAATANLTGLHQQLQAIAVRDMMPAPAPAPAPVPATPAP